MIVPTFPYWVLTTICHYLVLDVLLYLRIAIRTKETIILSRATARPHKNRFYVDITQYHKDHFYQTQFPVYFIHLQKAGCKCLQTTCKIFAENASVGRLLTILTHAHLQQKAFASFNLSVKNFSQILFKIRFTYIKLTLNFRKQCAANFILREFAAIQTSQDTYRERRKKAAFPVIVISLLQRLKKFMLSPWGNGSIQRPRVERHFELNSHRRTARQ